MAAKRTRKPLVLALCLHSLLVFSQTTFQKTLGGPGNEAATWVTEASNGCVIAGHITNTTGNQDALLIRIDATGNTIWQKRFGAASADAFHCVVSTTDGGFLAAGETRSFGAGYADIFLVKVNAAGSVVWSRTIGDAANDDVARSLTLAADGGFIVSGQTVLGATASSSSVFIRLDQSGNTIWSRTYITSFGNQLLSNYVDGNVIYASGGADSEAAFVRIDFATGNILSTRAYAGSSAESLSYAQPTQDGNLIIADQTSAAPTGSDVELWVQKINRSTGQVIWSKVYYRANDNIRGRIERVNDGGFLLVPYNNSNTAQSEALLAKIDGNGALLWSYNYGGAASDRLVKAVQTADGGFIAVGDTRSNNGNGNSDILLVKTNADGKIAGSCMKNAGIQSSGFTAANFLLETIVATWKQGAVLNTSPLPLNLLQQGFNPNAAPTIIKNIALCPNTSYNIGGLAFFAPKLVTDTVESLNGCDTIFKYNLTLTPFNTNLQVIGLCAGETYTYNGIQYTAPATFLDTIASTSGSCDTLYSIVLKSWAQPTLSQSISFCMGESVMIGGQVYAQAGTVQVLVPSVTGGCDTLVTYTLIERPQPALATSINFCAGESIIIGGNSYNQSGTVIASIPSTGAGCDTIVTYTLQLLPQPTLAVTLGFCPGKSVTIAGQIYHQPGTVQATIASTNGGCDTLVTYTLELHPQPTRTETRSFCPGESITIAGQSYNQSGIVVATVASTNGGCDTIVTYTLELRPQITRAETLRFCAGESVTIAGQVYNQPGTVQATIVSTNGGCDTLVTYTLELRQQHLLAETKSFCPGQSVTIVGQNYNQPGTVIVNLNSTTGGCDTIATYTLEFRPQPTRTQNYTFCPGESITIAGQTYHQSGTITANIASTTVGCDTIVTYNLELRQQPVRVETRSFCPGESIVIAGQTYTQPGVVVANLVANSGGCDTIVTYTLQYLTPAPSNIAIQCPNDVTVLTASGAGPVTATYADPVTASDCICPGLQLGRTNGSASGSVFPVGTTQVCYTVKDNCGQEKPCCFNVNIREEDPCDVKVSGCIKYEVLSITSDANRNYTYRVRVTNNCANKLIYTAIQVPDGLTAIHPVNNSYYTTQEGRTYLVRSPNYSPMYSIRFKSLSDSISNGQSDVFEYTLPSQADVSYINITSRLTAQVSYEAHLNTFKCAVGTTPNNQSSKPRDQEYVQIRNSLLLYPNPTTGVLYADLSDWQGQKLQVQVTNTQGQLVHSIKLLAEEDLLKVEMPKDLTAGVYFFELITEKGEKEVVRFMLQR